MKVTVHDVKADGSCFFRSIYYSAKYTGNLKYILKYVIDVKKPVLEDWTEELFVTEIRKAFAIKLRNGQFLNNIYAYLHEVYVNSRDTYNEIIMAYPTWFTRHFKHMPNTLESFKEKFASHILNKKNWVSQIEVEFFKTILTKRMRSSASASSTATSSKPPEFVIFNTLPPKTQVLNCTTMYILNIDEVHYNYILCRMCKPPKTKIINPVSKRCVSKNGKIGKELIKKGIQVY
jgi:hypothetical protein